MCDRYLHCPYCERRLVALCTIAGDNATGFFVEFFLVKPAGTEASAFVPSGGSIDVVSASVDSTTATAAGSAQMELLAAVGVESVGYPDERGFDDDEAPFPPKK